MEREVATDEATAAGDYDQVILLEGCVFFHQSFGLHVVSFSP
jgi:hypothetical protein